MSAEPVRFTCPRCAKRYKTPPARIEEAGGRLGVLCSRCHARLRVRLVDGVTETDLLSDTAGEPGTPAEGAAGAAPAEETAAPGAVPVTASLGVGARLGRYQVEGVLGQGGMGTVYKAFDPSVNRSVALKVLDPDAPPEDAARFEREVQVQANVKHPNLMPIYDSGSSDGLRWYTMELLREPLSLRDLVLMMRSGEAGRSPRLKPAASFQGLVKHVLLPVCRAIHHANVREGVLHRDLSPYNVLVDAAGLRPYVIDFGVCTLLERKNPRLQDLPLETSPVIDGQRKVTGTLVYMPPEQLRGQSDRRGDVWALGALLHAAVTGEPPLQPVAKGAVPRADRIEGLKLLIEQALRDGDASEVARFRATLLALQQGRERTAGDLHRDIVQGNYQPRPPWLDRALDAVIAKAMAVDPTRRYRNAKELADDLEAWLDGDAVAALAEQQSGFGRLLYSVRRGFQRHTALVGVVLVVGLGAAAFALWPRGPQGPSSQERAAPLLAAADVAAARQDWTAVEKAARAALEADPTSRRALALLQGAAAMPPFERGVAWVRSLVARAEEADRTGAVADAAEARAALRAVLRAHLFEPAAVGAPEEADLAARRRVAEDRRPLVVTKPGDVVLAGARRVGAEGRVEPEDGWPRDGALAPGRWVLRFAGGGRELWVPLEVAPTADRVPAACPVDPAALPPDCTYVPAGRVKGPLGESQVPALLWERTEVTVGRYGAWLATLPPEEQALRVPRVAGGLGGAPRPLWEKRDGRFVPPKSLAAEAPVDGISLYDARAFAIAQGRRLPTAQEWAWAATGPFAAASPVGNADALFRLPLVLGSAEPRPRAVASTDEDVGPFGLRDMAGNVAEWTSSLATLDGVNGWLVMGSGYGLPPERALVARAVPEPGWMPLQGVGLRCVQPAP